MIYQNVFYSYGARSGFNNCVISDWSVFWIWNSI